MTYRFQSKVRLVLVLVSRLQTFNLIGIKLIAGVEVRVRDENRRAEATRRDVHDAGRNNLFAAIGVAQILGEFRTIVDRPSTPAEPEAGHSVHRHIAFVIKRHRSTQVCHEQLN